MIYFVSIFCFLFFIYGFLYLLISSVVGLFDGELKWRTGWTSHWRQAYVHEWLGARVITVAAHTQSLRSLLVSEVSLCLNSSESFVRASYLLHDGIYIKLISCFSWLVGIAKFVDTLGNSLFRSLYYDLLDKLIKAFCLRFFHLSFPIGAGKEHVGTGFVKFWEFAGNAQGCFL